MTEDRALQAACTAIACLAMLVWAGLPAWLGAPRRAAADRARDWAHVFKASGRVAVFGRASDGDTLAVAELARSAGASVETLPPSALESAGTSPEGLAAEGAFDAVVLVDCLSPLEAPAARTALRRAVALTAPGGALFVRDLAAVPASTLLGLLRGALLALPARLAEAALRLSGVGLRGGLRCSAAHDAAQWLPSDARVEARHPDGWLHEIVAVRRLVCGPGEAVERLRRLYGDTSMAFCTTSAGNRIGVSEEHLRYHLADAFGYVAFTEHVVLGARLRLVIMDPVCAAADREATLRSFVGDCEAVGARPIFSCVSADCAAPLHQLGFHTTMLGSEVGIPLASFRLSKERRRYLRAGAAKGLECTTECYDMQELAELNDAWVQSKASGTEVTIWTWPPSLPAAEAGAVAAEPAGPEAEVRRLFAYQDGLLVGFVCAEPYYRGDGSGEVLGYGLNTIRFLPRLNPPWISDFTVASLVQQLQEEGKAEYLAFGLSPFCGVAERAGDLPSLRALFRMTWAANMEDVYSIQGLARKKAHHCAGQGVPLHDRFIAGVPRHAIPDTARFMTLLCADSMIYKVPGAFAKMISAKLARLAGRLAGAARRRFATR